MLSPRENTGGSRVIVSVLGHDKVGIIAAVANILAENNINILDINQTIIQEFFTMMLIADLSNTKISLAELKASLAKKGEELGLRIEAQHEDVFHYMHRI